MCTTIRWVAAFATLVAGGLGALGVGAETDAPVYGFGTTPTPAEIAAVDIDVQPDGRGLPAGSGDHDDGAAVYAAKCVRCHGPALEGVPETGGGPLIGGRGSLATGNPVKTVESFWPYATTLFDYTRRAMPFDAPGSLSDAEVYAVVAYVLAEGRVIEKTTRLDATNLAAVRMPNREGFVPDPRPDVPAGR